jgi:hypothetical protein
LYNNAYAKNVIVGDEESAMDLEVAEIEAVQKLLAYVNGGRVADAAAVYALFAHDAGTPQLAERQPGTDLFQPLWIRPLAETGSEAAGKLESDRAEAQVLLEQFAESRTWAREHNTEKIAELIGKGVLACRPSFADGHVTQLLQFQGGVEAQCGYGLALLYDNARGYGEALRRCALDSCRQWLLAVPGHRRHCSDAHRRQADKERAPARARRWRTSKRSRKPNTKKR